jgi:uridine kinase
MNELAGIVAEHFVRYPASGIQDLTKLVYQNEFGCGHLLDDPVSGAARLREEWGAASGQNGGSLFEDIGNGLARMHIAAAKDNHIPESLFYRAFVCSAQERRGTMEGFRAKIELLPQLCRVGALPFDPDAIGGFIEAWRLKGCPPFSHSDPYKAAYRPAYRVVLAQCAELLPLACEIFGRQNSKTVLAIDGRCGAGKTTMAKTLAALLDAAVVHMDDFFLPGRLRTDQRLAEAGGNIHYERFLDEVIAGLRSGKAFQYRKFSCAEMDYTDVVTVEEKPVTIVEGVYSMHPLFQKAYDIRVFCDIDKDRQQSRLLVRDGAERYKQYRDRWIPLEETYFKTFKIRESCDCFYPALCSF